MGHSVKFCLKKTKGEQEGTGLVGRGACDHTCQLELDFCTCGRRDVFHRLSFELHVGTLACAYPQVNIHGVGAGWGGCGLEQLIDTVSSTRTR